MATVSLARNAMATRFEIVLNGDDPVRLRAAGEEALQEIERLEAQLSLFRPTSEIAHLNALAAKEPVRVTPALFSLLQQARQLTLETGGAFDITIAPLVRCWGFHSGAGRRPSKEELEHVRKSVGMQHVLLVPEEFTVQFTKPGVRLDLGAIGKGFAIDKAVELLREAGVTSALIHGGTSTVFALGSPPDASHWTIGLPVLANPPAGRVMPGIAESDTSIRPLYSYTDNDEPGQTIKIPLRDEAFSVSAVWGRFFEADGESFGHIIDPRTGQPAKAASVAAVALPSATESDALSTALLTLGLEGHDTIARLRQGIRSFVASGWGKALRTVSQGILENSSI